MNSREGVAGGESVPIEARGHSLSASILTEESLDWAQWITVVRAV